jgi:hypothetical protein
MSYEGLHFTGLRNQSFPHGGCKWPMNLSTGFFKVNAKTMTLNFLHETSPTPDSVYGRWQKWPGSSTALGCPFGENSSVSDMPPGDGLRNIAIAVAKNPKLKASSTRWLSLIAFDSTMSIHAQPKINMKFSLS